MTKQESNQIISAHYNTLRHFNIVGTTHFPKFENYAIRTTHKPGVELPNYCTPGTLCDTIELAQRYIQLGVPEEHITIWECAPHNLLAIHAEVCKTDNGYSCRYSFEKCPMREAFKIRSFNIEGKSVPPCFAYMDAIGKEQLLDILDRFPDHIVELSCFNAQLGESWSNTVFWEIRPYV